MNDLTCSHTRVKKAWGHEEIVVNDGFCFKRLLIKKGYQVSYHKHKVKDELFYLERGLVRIDRNGTVFLMRPGQWLRIFPGDWHTMAGIEESVLLCLSWWQSSRPFA